MNDLWIIDAFTDVPFRGNPAGVCWLDRPADPEWMQSLAMELNQAETAFLVPAADGFDLRWFTPAFEVDLCGHATLASAHFLAETGRIAGDGAVSFHTRSGVLTATPASGNSFTLDFPASPPSPIDPPDGLLAALGLGPGPAVFSNHLAQQDYLVRLPDAAAVRAVAPNFRAVGALPARGVIVTAPGDTPDVDFVSRFFAPAAGIDEDPVTGSAHCTLAPYWSAETGRPELVGYQASKRGGLVRTALHGNRVRLTGRAVTVLRGTVTPR